MKKQELIEILTRYITEAIGKVKEKEPKVKFGKHADKYWRSRWHPDEITARKIAKAHAHDTELFTGIPMMAPEPGFDIPQNIKRLLNTSLQMMPGTYSSMKVLNGQPISRKEADDLARRMMLLPGFPLQQPRKLTNLLVLLALENAKT